MSRNIVCVILAAGHSELLYKDIEWGEYKLLRGKPKALLPAPGGKCILDFWWDVIKMRQLFTEVYLVSNADKYKHFERWATASDFPLENLINDGSTLPTNSLGSLADFELVLRVKNLWEQDVVVIAGDMLFQDCKFEMSQVLEFFRHKSDGDVAIYYEMHESESTLSRGIVEVCSETKRIMKFLEKPKATQTNSRYASVVFYCFRPLTLQNVLSYLKSSEIQRPNFGSFMQWLINEEKVTVYGMKLPTGFQLIGDVGLKDYESWVKYFTKQAHSFEIKGPITKRAYARVGLIGNPSDGFFGKTISLSIKNFWAETTIEESPTLRLIPHPLNDPTEFGSLSDLHGISSKEGYQGGLRLLQATCKMIALSQRNFTLSYDTNIPRQVGLAGSSAIVTATLKCLMEFYNLTESDLPKPLQPKFILEVEKEELMINAGLQDRVVQVYEGLIYMDFTRDLMNKLGHGHYEYININSTELPRFFLTYLSNPSDSGKIHSDVSTRFHTGDKVVQQGMSDLASLTDETLVAINERRWNDVAKFMQKNFSLRRQMYGDAVLGKSNIKMIEIGQKHGVAVKFPGSGGAVLGLLNSDTVIDDLRKEYQSHGCVFVEVIPHIPQ
ncbi:putative glucuronokinase 2 [Armadillidium vulgare]|nr:putative glucuronokinase 2 [Armadillidium vulgare]